MTKKKSKSKEAAATTTTEKKLYLIRAEDVAALEPFVENGTQIECIRLKLGGRIVQIDDTPKGREVLTSNIRRIVGEKVTTQLISGGVEDGVANREGTEPN